MEYLKSWFRGFEQGIADLQPQQREVLFRACAVNCVHGGPFGLYRSLFEAAEGDLDRFFCENRRTGRRSRRNRVCGTGVQPLFRGLFLCPAPCGVREYADVVRMFAAKLLYVMSELWPDRKFGVEVRASILRGAYECVLNVRVE